MRRRGFIAGLAAGIAVAAAGVYRFTDLFVKHYAPTPYDDVLAQLVDREQAAKLGVAALNGLPGFDARVAAMRLRATLGGGLAAAVAADAMAGHVREVDGWLVPESLALLSALAAKA
jgi:hypothetical protein